MAAKPRSHRDEDNEDDDKKVYKTKKVLFVDSHGAKSFPYRGRRTHFSSIKQILGNNTDRHNDLFGLTIFQFDREFKACLERRKQNEPQILNMLFPIKTDNRYLEYLENTQSQQTGNSYFII
jgi:endonuclease IV